MKRKRITAKEKQQRQFLLKDLEQWRARTGNYSRMSFAQERGIELRYLLNCIKWQYEECKREDKKTIVSQAGSKQEGFPSLVAVTKKAEPTKSASSVVESAISIRMKASSIDIAGDITPILLAQLLSTLGALNVL